MKKSKSTRTISLFVRITRSVIFLVVGLFLLTGIVLGAIVYNSTKKQMISELNEMSIAYTKVVEKELGILHEQVNSICSYAVELPGLLSSTEINDILAGMKDEKGVQSIYGMDRFGGTSTPGVTVNDREYYIEAMKGKFYASSPFLKSDNTVGITVAVPAYRNKEIDGVVSIGIDYNYFSKFVDFKIGETGSSYIIDKNGTVVAHQNSDLVLNFYNAITEAESNPALKDQADLITRFLNGDYSVGTYETAEGVKKTAVAQPITDTAGWLLITTMETSEMNQTAVLVLGVLAGIVLVGIVIAVIAAMTLARGISKPISDINKRLTQLSEGDLSSPVERIHTRDEIQTLSQSLYDTVMQLRMYIQEISVVTKNMASYNLNTEISGDFRGEFLPIKDSLNRILAVMNDSFIDISEASEQVNMGSGQVSMAAQALSNGTIQQARSIEELSATISDISQKVTQNADSSQSANEKVNDVRAKLEENNDLMNQLNQAMEQINASSSEIGKIIKTIEDIAFQTNILALNAAVEAARAGVAGKGFAVVADEVRNLATKSAEAAKNTTNLIEGSIHAVENGISVAEKTAQQLEKVVTGAIDVSDMVNNISEASKEQAIIISQINDSIDQISSVVQTNSATAEESAAASEQLTGQASMLHSLTDRFTLKRR